MLIIAARIFCRSRQIAGASPRQLPGIWRAFEWPLCFHLGLRPRASLIVLGRKVEDFICSRKQQLESLDSQSCLQRWTRWSPPQGKPGRQTSSIVVSSSRGYQEVYWGTEEEYQPFRQPKPCTPSPEANCMSRDRRRLIYIPTTLRGPATWGWSPDAAVPVWWALPLFTDSCQSHKSNNSQRSSSTARHTHLQMCSIQPQYLYSPLTPSNLHWASSRTRTRSFDWHSGRK